MANIKGSSYVLPAFQSTLAAQRKRKRLEETENKAVRNITGDPPQAAMKCMLSSPRTCAAREDECSVSNEGLVQTMHFTYTECPCAFSTGLKSPGPWGRHCQRDPQTLIHDGHGAASTVGTPLHINHWKCTLHAAFALHTGPKAGGVQHEQQHNAQILTECCYLLANFPKWSRSGCWFPQSYCLVQIWQEIYFGSGHNMK